jgi:hypothetical protein
MVDSNIGKLIFKYFQSGLKLGSIIQLHDQAHLGRNWNYKSIVF